MERLRHLARAGALEHGVLVQEGAQALAALHHDPAGLLLASRRLLERHPGSGPLWWLCARMLTSDSPAGEGWACAREVDTDATAGHLAQQLPLDATVVVLGWPEVAAPALAQRGDVRVLVVDARAEGFELVAALRRVDVDAVDVPEAGVAAAVGAADLVVLEAGAAGPEGLLAVAGSLAAAAVAAQVGVPVWAVAGVGRLLPAALWSELVARQRRPEPWSAGQEIVPFNLTEAVVRPEGLVPLPDPLRPDCLPAPELLSASPASG